MLQYVIILPLVFLAGFVDSISGGGGLISLSAFMLSGLPVHNAIATNKLCSTMGTSVSVIKYARKGFIPWKTVIIAIICAYIGSTCGVRIALAVDDRYFKMLMLVLVPIIAFYVLRGKAYKDDYEPYPPKKTIILCALIALGVGLYDGFYGPGAGTFLILLFTSVAHLKLTTANGACKTINLTTNIAATLVYLMNGKAILLLAILSGLCNMAGNWFGANCFVKGGAKFTKPLTIVVLAIFMVKIILELVGVL